MFIFFLNIHKKKIDIELFRLCVSEVFPSSHTPFSLYTWSSFKRLPSTLLHVFPLLPFLPSPSLRMPSLPLRGDVRRRRRVAEAPLLPLSPLLALSFSSRASNVKGGECCLGAQNNQMYTERRGRTRMNSLRGV